MLEMFPLLVEAGLLAADAETLGRFTVTVYRAKCTYCHKAAQNRSMFLSLNVSDADKVNGV